MSERDRDLRVAPEKAPPVDLERLVLSFAAAQDLIAAQQLYSQLHDVKSRAFEMIKLAEAQAGLGINPQPIITEIKTTADSIEDDTYNQANLYGGIARVQARLGDIPAALRTIEQASLKNGFMTPFVYIYIVELQIEAGASAEELIKKAVEAVEKGSTGSVHQAHVYSRIALVQKRAGFSPKELLNRAIQKLEETEGRAGYSYGLLAERFAECGYYTEAVALVQRIGGDTPERAKQLQNNTIWAIASKQAQAGLFDEAVETVSRTGDIYYLADVTSQITVLAARSGAGAEERVKEALTNVAAYENSIKRHRYKKYYQTRVARMYATIAEAQTTLGLDPHPLFEMAIARASSALNTDEEAITLAEIARVQARIGINARATFLLALASADEIVKTAEKNNTVFWTTPIEQLLAYEDVAKAAIECGYDDLLEKAFERFDRFDQEESTGDSSYEKAELLVKRARERAKRALSIAEIKRLTPSQINAIRSGDNESAKQAVQYFQEQGLINVTPV